MPWYLKLGLGTGVAYATVKATAARVAQEPAWNRRTLKWFGAMLAQLVVCGVVTYYYHLYGEEDDRQDEQGTSIASMRDTLVSSCAKEHWRPYCAGSSPRLAGDPKDIA
jgi:hypothetical protein